MLTDIMSALSPRQMLFYYSQPFTRVLDDKHPPGIKTFDPSPTASPLPPGDIVQVLSLPSPQELPAFLEFPKIIHWLICSDQEDCSPGI